MAHGVVFAAVAAPLAGRRWVWHLHDRLAPDYLSGGALAAMHRPALPTVAEVVAGALDTTRDVPRLAHGGSK